MKNIRRACGHDAARATQFICVLYIGAGILDLACYLGIAK